MLGILRVEMRFMFVILTLAAVAPAADAATLTITFNPPATNVSVTRDGLSNPPGAEQIGVCLSPGPCTFTIANGTPIVVAAPAPATNPIPGVLGGGTGAAAGCAALSTCAFVINMDSALTVTSAAPGPVPTITINPPGDVPFGEVTLDGLSCPPSCSLAYVAGSTVRLRERSSPSCPDCQGTGFSGACASNGSFCIFTLNQNATVTAFFTVSPHHDGHRDALAMRLTCAPTARRGRSVDAMLDVRNQSGQQITLTRAAVGLHVGNVSFVGPLAVNPLDAMTHAPAFPRALVSDADASLVVPVTIPSSARPGTFVSVGVSLLGREGGSTGRKVLGSERCSIEVLP